jgi:hypothetical protein
MMNLNELALKVTEEMLSAGYSNVTSWRTYLDAYRPLISFHKKHGLETYDPVVTTDFCNQLIERRLNGTYSRGNAARILSGISRLRHYCDTGRIDYEFPKKGTSFKINSHYERLLNEYAADNEVSSKTRSDIIWIARKFFSWLIKNGPGETHQYKKISHCRSVSSGKGMARTNSVNRTGINQLN